jgi:glutathione S-transferase
MYTVYSRPGSGGFIVEAALTIAGAPFEVVNIDRQNPPSDYFELSPFGQVPALTLPDGRTITESAAICLLLMETFPNADLGPRAGERERPEFLRWVMFLASMLYPALMRYWFSSRCTTEPEGKPAVKQAAIIDADRGFNVIEQALEGRAWLAGDRRSVADLYVLVLAHWHPVSDKPRPEWVNIVALCERLKTDPVLAKLNETHRLW